MAPRMPTRDGPHEFPQSVIERLGFYVYRLRDPRTVRVFYIGKGTGNRLFAHVNGALESADASDKLSTIRAIHAAGRRVKHEVIRHGLSEEVAFEVEAALIEAAGLDRIANAVNGHRSGDRGMMSVADLIATYGAKPITIVEPALLIVVNRLYRRSMTPAEVYAATRGNWVLGPRREKARLALSVFRGLVREVFEIHGWTRAKARDQDQRVQSRWRFRGVPSAAHRHYVGGCVASYIREGAQNPIKYVNC